MKRLLLLLLTVEMALSLMGQSLSFSESALPAHYRYDKSSGLLSNAVYCVLQDHQGFLWIGTDAGVSRFDGRDFVHYTVDDGICDNEILRLYEDSKGRVWFLSLSGCLTYCKDGVIHSQVNDSSLRTDAVFFGMTCALEDPMGRIWFSGMSRHLVYYDGQRSSTIQIDTTLFPVVQTNAYLYQSKNQELHYFYANKQFVLDAKEGWKYDSWLTDRTATNCFVNLEGGYARISLTGLEVMKDGSGKKLTGQHFSPVLENAMGFMLYGNEGWIPDRRRGAHRIDIQDSALHTCVYFSDEYISYVYLDRSGGHWFCTRDHGLICVESENFNSQRFNLHQDELVTAIVAQGDMILFGTNQGRVLKVESSAGAKIQEVQQFDEPIQHIRYGQKSFVILTQKRAWIWSIADSKPKEIPLENPKSIYLDERDTLFLSQINGVFKWVGDRLEIIRGIPPSRIYALLIHTDGSIWYEQHQKLFRFENGMSTEIKGLSPLCQSRICAMEECSDGSVIVATKGNGLFRVNQQEVIKHWNKSNGLFSNECTYINKSNEFFLIGTKGGVYYLGAALDQLEYLNLGLDDLNVSEIVRAGDDYVFGTNGWVGILPAEVKIQKSAPPALFIKTGPDGTDASKEVFLSIDRGEPIALVLTAIHFPNHAGLKYRYSFSSDSTRWFETDQSEWLLNEMPYGEHTVYAQVKSPSSNWSESVLLHVEVRTPIWRRSWFLLGSVLMVLVLIVYAIYAKAQRRIKLAKQKADEQQRLLEERNRISSDLHDELGAELSNIVILSRIANSLPESNSEIGNYILRIDHVANEVITKMNGIIWALNPLNDHSGNLVDYLKKYFHEWLEIQQSEGKFVEEIEDRKIQVNALFRRNVFLIVKEALQNCSKYAKGARVEILISVREAKLHLEIKDNGPGFLKSDVYPNGLGLGSMKRRANDMGGILQVESSLDQGTIVVLYVPLVQNHPNR